MAITPLPALDRTSVTFKADADTFFGSRLPTFSTEAEAARVEINTNTNTASTAATTAMTKAGEALTSANNAATSKTGADTARDAAVVARTAAETALDSFDDRYLGAKATAPTLDNDGAALLTGALYWDTSLPGMRSWNGTDWVTLPAATAAAIANTPAGNIAATTVQAAINELDAEKAKSGANSDITSLSGLTTPLSVAQGGTGVSAGAVIIGASREEMEAAASTALAVTPGMLQFHPGAAKAWVLFDGKSGGTVTNNGSYNVASLTDLGTGHYRVNLTTAFSSTNFVAAALSRAGAGVQNIVCVDRDTALAAGSLSIYCVNPATPGTLQDEEDIRICMFGDQ